jgi:hypothetical protein
MIRSASPARSTIVSSVGAMLEGGTGLEGTPAAIL